MSNFKTLIAAALVAASSTVAFADNSRVDNARLYAYGPVSSTVMVEGRNAADFDAAHSNDNGKLSASIYQTQRNSGQVVEGRNAADQRPVAPDIFRAGSDR